MYLVCVTEYIMYEHMFECFNGLRDISFKSSLLSHCNGRTYCETTIATIVLNHIPPGGKGGGGGAFDARANFE